MATSAGSRRSAHYSLAILYLICLVSYVDRQLIALLAADIQRELGLRDWQLGFVSGTAFAVLYVFMGIPLSRFADRTHRVRLLGLCLAAWSAMTAACGLITGFVQLALARVGVAIGEAGGYPTSLSLISDLYPAERRATVTSIFLSATTAGALVSLVIGGILNEALGWRWTFVIAAIPGLILCAVLLFTVREPARGAMDDTPATQTPPDAMSLWATLRSLFARPLYRYVAIGGAIGNIELFSLAAWTPTYALRTFQTGTAAVGLGLGLGLGLVSGLVMIVAGSVADRLSQRQRVAAVYMAAAGQLLFIPLLLLALATRQFPLFCLLYALAYGLSACGGPITIAATQSIVPANQRATAAALLVMLSTLSGYGLGPPLIGAISDSFATGSPADRLRGALMIGTVFSAAYALLLLRGAALARRAG